MWPKCKKLYNIILDNSTLVEGTIRRKQRTVVLKVNMTSYLSTYGYAVINKSHHVSICMPRFPFPNNF